MIINITIKLRTNYDLTSSGREGGGEVLRTDFARLFVTVFRPAGDSKVIFMVFESSFSMLLPVYSMLLPLKGKGAEASFIQVKVKKKDISSFNF